MSHVMFITGSLRQDSYNSMLLGYLETLLPWDYTVDSLGSDAVALPLFNEDIEADPSILAICHALHERFASAQGFLIATPEYNGQVTAYLKNTIDWVSRLSFTDETKVNPFLDKPVLLSSSSSGYRGGQLAVSSARDLMAYVGATVIGGAIGINNAVEKWMDSTFHPSEHEAAEISFHLSRWLSSVDLISSKGM
jgi:chromate reductase